MCFLLAWTPEMEQCAGHCRALRLGMLFRMLRSVDAIGNGVPIDYVG
jgi:hypothetical protein